MSKAHRHLNFDRVAHQPHLDSPLKKAIDKIVENAGKRGSPEGMEDLDIDYLEKDASMMQTQYGQPVDEDLNAAASLALLSTTRENTCDGDNAPASEPNDANVLVQNQEEQNTDQNNYKGISAGDQRSNETTQNVSTPTLSILLNQKPTGELLKIKQNGITHYHPNYFDLTLSIAVQAPTPATKFERKWFHNHF